MFTCLRSQYRLIHLQRCKTRDHFVKEVLLVRFEFIRGRGTDRVLTEILYEPCPVSNFQREKLLDVRSLARHIYKVGIDQKDLVHFSLNKFIDDQPSNRGNRAELRRRWKITKIRHD